MDDRFILFGLHEINGIGPKSIQNIVNQVPKLQELLTFHSLQTNSPGHTPYGLPFSLIQLIKENLSEQFINNRMDACRTAGVDFVTVIDDHYPESLKQSSQPPWVLYYKGNYNLLSNPLIAMVGTRTPTVYGKKVAEMLSNQLSQYGICVVSGMARGIDSECHKGAIQGLGSTIAVVGSGIDIVYPPENASLSRAIADKGLILSEYPLGTKAHPGLFPMRNRIIAGLCMGTVVVEAAVKSGSLITADQCLDESRDLFAVPGPITSPKSVGAISLLKKGAKLVTCAEDIVEEYKQRLMLEHINVSTAKPNYKLSRDELFILDFISYEPVTFDTLLEKSKFYFGHLHSVLLSLILKNKIEQLPGSSYIAI
ncbi:MAG TPA: DNA-processing protein DprA [Bacilli bacterium]